MLAFNAKAVVVQTIADDLNITKEKTFSPTCDVVSCHYRYVISSFSFPELTSLSYAPIVSITKNTETGSFYLHIQAKNMDNGNESAVVTALFKVDNTTPIVTGIASEGSRIPSKNWTWGCADTSSCDFRFILTEANDNSALSSEVYDSTVSHEVSGIDGIRYLHVQAKDEAGNESDVTTVFAEYSATIPSASVGTLTGLPLNSFPIDFKCLRPPNIADNDASYTCEFRYVVDQLVINVPGGLYSTPAPHTLNGPDGDYYIHIQVKDNVGNESEVSHFKITIDNTSPSISGLTNHLTPTELVNWVAVCSETPCEFRYELSTDNNFDLASKDWVTTSNVETKFRTGTHFYHIQARDAAGNESIMYMFEANMIDNSGNYALFEIENAGRALTLGLNPSTHEPISGSDWTVEKSSIFAGNCNQFPNHIFDDGDDFKIINSYLAPTTPDCATATSDSDPDNNLTWVDLGLVQKAEFGLEAMTCGTTAVCDINQFIVTEDKIFSTVTPTDGVNGTDSGKATVFAYDIYNYSLTNQRGVGGNGGSNTLPVVAYPVNYCLQLKDAISEGLGSEYAKTPLLQMRKITWKPIVSDSPGENGTTSTSQIKKVEIYLKTDHLMRYFLESDITVGF